MRSISSISLAVVLLLLAGPAFAQPRVIVTSDGEVDGECSPVRFLIYANEWDVEGIKLWHPTDTTAKPGQTSHIIAEVTDRGSPLLTRYERVVVEVE